jgi:hypothetical protein
MKSVSSVYRDRGVCVIFVSLYWFARLVDGLTAKGRVRYHVGPCVISFGQNGTLDRFTWTVSFLHRSIPIHSTQTLDSDVK